MFTMGPGWVVCGVDLSETIVGGIGRSFYLRSTSFRDNLLGGKRKQNWRSVISASVFYLHGVRWSISVTRSPTGEIRLYLPF